MMKIIELLNKIANGEEVPKMIKINGEIWIYDEEIDYRASDDRGYLFEVHTRTNCEDLNEEVEILEEEKKIPEKFNITYEKNCKNNYKWKCEGYNISTPQKLIADKINSIIDYLKSKGE